MKLPIRLALCAAALIIATRFAGGEDSNAPSPASETSATNVVKAPAAGPETVEVSKSMWEYYVIGGWCMHPILACSIATIALCIACGIVLWRKRWFSQAEEDQLAELMRGKRVRSAIDLCGKSRLTLMQTLLPGLKLVRKDAPNFNRVAVDFALTDSVSKLYNKYLPTVSYISICATIAPMWGLLGTVSGMVKAFDKIGILGMGAPEKLAGNIGEALLTTFFGLTVGIPAMFFFFYFKTRLRSLVEEMQEKINFQVGQLTGESVIVEEEIPEG